MQITKNFDVKISVVHPYLTKNISSKDSERISRNTLFKYEPQKTIATPQFASQPVTEEDESDKDAAARLIKRFKEMYDGFDTLRTQAANNLSNVVYEYDLELIDNEPLATAEETLFGLATGKITFEKYQQALELTEAIMDEMRRRGVQQGGQVA